jgi:hypothetical protein
MPSTKIYRRKRVRRSRPALTASLSAGVSFPFGDLSVPAFQFSSAAALPVPQAQSQPVIDFQPSDKLIADCIRAAGELIARYPRETGLALTLSGLFLLYPKETSMVLGIAGLLYVLANARPQGRG